MTDNFTDEQRARDSALSAVAADLEALMWPDILFAMNQLRLAVERVTASDDCTPVIRTRDLPLVDIKKMIAFGLCNAMVQYVLDTLAFGTTDRGHFERLADMQFDEAKHRLTMTWDRAEEMKGVLAQQEKEATHATGH